MDGHERITSGAVPTVSGMPRTCAFCGAPADSQEHVWPDWLRRATGTDEAMPHVITQQRGFDEPEIIRQWDDQPYKLTVRAVCRDCNNGWMSQLEHDAQRILSGMIAGRGREMHRGEQTRLATWAFKTAVMFDRVLPEDSWIIPPAQAHALWDHLQPPPATRIWLASYNENYVGISGMNGSEATLEGQEITDVRNVYIRTFTMGPVVFQVYGTTNPGLADLDVTWPIPTIHQIWPFKGAVTWRPSPAMNDQELALFTDHIAAGLKLASLSVDP
jgi:hypothetical protein